MKKKVDKKWIFLICNPIICQAILEFKTVSLTAVGAALPVESYYLGGLIMLELSEPVIGSWQKKLHTWYKSNLVSSFTLHFKERENILFRDKETVGIVYVYIYVYCLETLIYMTVWMYNSRAS